MGVAMGAVLVVATLCFRLGVDRTAGTASLAAVAVLGSLALPVRLAAIVGLGAWAFDTGFVVNAGGQLTFGSPDLERLVLLVLVAAAASMAGRSAHVHVGTAGPVGFSDPQDLAGHGGDLAHPEEQEAQQLGDRVALGPLEVDVRDHPGAVAHVQQQRGQRVGDRG